MLQLRLLVGASILSLVSVENLKKFESGLEQYSKLCQKTKELIFHYNFSELKRMTKGT